VLLKVKTAKLINKSLKHIICYNLFVLIISIYSIDT